MEVNPADVAGVRIPYNLGTAEFSIAPSALYQLLLLNPHRGCGILSGLRERERFRRLKDAWAANNPCWAALGELGWEGCPDKDILMSSCGINPSSRPDPSAPPRQSPPPPRNPNPLPCPPPPNPCKARRPPYRSASPSNRAAPRRRISQSPVPMERGRGAGAAKKARGAPSLEGDGSPDPLIGEHVYLPYTHGVYPGDVTSFVAGAGGRVWVEHPMEEELFRVERHLLYASHAAAVTHWENQKAAAACKKAAKAKRGSNPKADADPPAEPASKLAKPEPKPEAKQAPQAEPNAAPEAAPMEEDAPVHPSAKPAAQPPAQTHAQAPDGGETQATASLWEDPTGPSPEV